MYVFVHNFSCNSSINNSPCIDSYQLHFMSLLLQIVAAPLLLEHVRPLVNVNLICQVDILLLDQPLQTWRVSSITIIIQLCKHALNYDIMKTIHYFSDSMYERHSYQVYPDPLLHGQNFNHMHDQIKCLWAWDLCHGPSMLINWKWTAAENLIRPLLYLSLYLGIVCILWLG